MPSAVNSRRNVISTRSPIGDRVGVHVGELHREPAAAVEVHDREHDRRARRVRQLVDGEGDDGRGDVGHRRRLHVVDRATGRSTRAPAAGAARRCCGPCEPTNAELPVLGAPGRGRRHAGRLGPARRLDRDHAAPREELAVREIAAGFDLRARRAGRTGTRRSRRSCGRAARRRRRRARRARSPRRARPARARSRAAARDARRRCCRPSSRGRRRPRRRGRRAASSSARTARACSPVTTTRSTWSGRQLRRLQRRVPRLLAERDVLRLAEPLLPDLGAPVAGRAPAVEELLGRRAAARGTRR